MPSTEAIHNLFTNNHQSRTERGKKMKLKIARLCLPFVLQILMSPLFVFPQQLHTLTQHLRFFFFHFLPNWNFFATYACFPFCQMIHEKNKHTIIYLIIIKCSDFILQPSTRNSNQLTKFNATTNRFR